MGRRFQQGERCSIWAIANVLPPSVESGKDPPVNLELTVSPVEGLHLLSTHQALLQHPSFSLG